MNIKIIPYYILHLHLLKESKNKEWPQQCKDKQANRNGEKAKKAFLVILILYTKEMSNVSYLSTWKFKLLSFLKRNDQEMGPQDQEALEKWPSEKRHKMLYT